jgi:aldose 1-epimerase
MAFTVRQLSGSPAYRLEDSAGNAAEARPDLGFNCYRWQAPHQGKTLDLLFADESLLGPGGRPTRGGIPILFPFPNRIRDGRFTWDGKEYQLPLNGPGGRHAIHGFACRHSWRVVGQGADDGKAWLTGEFASADAPDSRGLWPADYRLRVTYLLFDRILRIVSEVDNPGPAALPFGLGFHPYFRLPFLGDGPDDDGLVMVKASLFWELDDSIPTGRVLPVDPPRDLNQPRRYAELSLDDVLTGLPADSEMDQYGVIDRAVLRSGEATLRLWCGPDFRELVVFTPPHRHAFCVEPYTCTTDAVNLQARGVEAGWRVLPPGGQWSSVVDLRVE